MGNKYKYINSATMTYGFQHSVSLVDLMLGILLAERKP